VKETLLFLLAVTLFVCAFLVPTCVQFFFSMPGGYLLGRSLAVFEEWRAFKKKRNC
jgi:hypothetical protein